jgi:hypothetical protein
MTANAAANWTRYGLERNSKLLGKLALVDAGTLFYQRGYYKFQSIIQSIIMRFWNFGRSLTFVTDTK